MKNRFVLLPRDFSKVPIRELGPFAAQQKKLQEYGFSVPKLAVIPLATLKTIASANAITEKLGKVLSSTEYHDPVSCTKLKKTVTSVLTTAKIPTEILQELSEMYHHFFSRSPVTILAEGSTSQHQNVLQRKQVSGDATVFRSILELWAEHTLSTLFKTHSKHIHTALYATILTLQESVPAELHGLAYTKHPKTGAKNTVYIVCNAPDHDSSESNYSSTYEVDIRTWNIIKRNIPKAAASPQLFSLYKKTPTLSDSQIIHIAKVTDKLKKQNLDHKVVSWNFTKNTVVITGINTFDPHEVRHSTPHRTMLELYTSAGNPDKSTAYRDLPISGIGLLKSEYSFLKFGVHPEALIKSGKQKLLESSVLQTLQRFDSFPHISRIIYKAFDIPSNDLRSFEHATTYESIETNPWLGSRGAFRQIHQPHIFELELKVLQAFAKESASKVALLLPLVRSAAELHLLQQKIKTKSDTGALEIWLQLTTPENILNIAAYDLSDIAGVSFQIDSLVHMLYGLDPTNTALTETYHPNTNFICTLITQAVTSIRRQQKNNLLKETPILFQMEHYNPRYIKLAVTLGITAVTVRPTVAPLAKACIIDYETAPLKKTSNTVSKVVVI